MMANRIVKIKDICHVIKGETGITKAIPGDYPMVTLAEERKTHNEFQFDCKAVIIPLVSSTGHGHASMKRIHFQEGKFALGSILCALVPKKEKEYVPEYLYHILDLGKERIFVPLMKGMANVSLPMNRIKAVEINLPPYEEQLRLAEIYQEVSKNIDLLKNETIKQKDYIPKLRQSILQMAVQGKLTARWREENPDVESVTDLYEKIKIENEEIKSKYNLRNQKTLLEISEDEKLFQTPDSWAWFRLGKLFYTTSGGTPTRGNTDYWDGNIPWLKSGELTDGLITKEAEEKITELGHKKSSTNLFPKDTLLIALYGATAGKLGILTYPSTTNQAICGFYANSNIETDYLFYYLWAFRSKILSDSWGQAQPNISQDYLKKYCFALPPHEEQKAIVSKVKQLMAWCDELEKKIEKRDVYQAKMMQAVVKQAFKTEKETVEME
jgi:type I restriction enzyme S subunit